MIHVTVSRSKAETVTIRMAQNSRHSDTIVIDCSMRVDIVQATKISSDLARFLVDLGKVIRVAQAVLANLDRKSVV